jgi:hypothetical protein
MTKQLLSLLAIATLLAAPAPARADVDQPNEAERSLRAQLDRDLDAFNRGDFKGYLADFAPKVSYNELTVTRDQMIELNHELKQTFPNLRMRYDRVRLQADTPDEAWATTVADFSGQTRNYDGSGFPATYHESGQITALYKRVNGQWSTDQLQVAWDDSYIDIGEPFGVLGFSALPTLAGAGQPYQFRLWVGQEYMTNTQQSYAYTMVPLATVLDKKGSEQIFGSLKFAPVPQTGLNLEMHAPEQPGTYVHLLVLNKIQRTRYGEAPIGQKVYTRVVRVEE